MIEHMATSENIFSYVFFKIDEDYTEVIIVCWRGLFAKFILTYPSYLIHNTCDLLKSIKTYSCKTCLLALKIYLIKLNAKTCHTFFTKYE